jgi:Glycosyl hydrolase family 99
MVSRLGLLGLIAGLLIGAALSPSLHASQQAQASNERLVLAFYYAWYDRKTWESGKVPDVPLTPYASANREAMARQIDQAQNAGIDAFVLNWWGKGNPTEKNLKTLLDVAAQKGFHVAADFDINSPFMGGVESYADNLRHLHTVHAAHSAYLRYQGRPVVFFYNVSRLPVSTWQSLRDQVDPNHTSLWIAEGTDLSYQSVFDGHHLYSVIWPNRIPPSKTLPQWGNRVRKYNQEHNTAKLWIATVMPGYDDRKARPGSGFAQSRQGGEYYRQSWQAAIASKAQWVIINSFNEWPEGSYVEPSQAYGNLYLDLTGEWAARFKGALPAVGAARSSPPTPTSLPTPTPLPPTPTSLPVGPARPRPTSMLPLPTPMLYPPVYFRGGKYIPF